MSWYIHSKLYVEIISRYSLSFAQVEFRGINACRLPSIVLSSRAKFTDRTRFASKSTTMTMTYASDPRVRSSCEIYGMTQRPECEGATCKALSRTVGKRVRCFCRAFCLALNRRCVTRVIAGLTHRWRLIRANNSSPTLVWKMQRDILVEFI